MFNYVNGNPFGKKVESTLSTGQDNSRNKEQQNQEKEEKRYLENEDADEVKIGVLPELSEDDILYLVNEYIENSKKENIDNQKIVERLDKYLSKFDVKKFMKDNPGMTRPDFCMIMYNEIAPILN